MEVKQVMHPLVIILVVNGLCVGDSSADAQDVGGVLTFTGKDTDGNDNQVQCPHNWRSS